MRISVRQLRRVIRESIRRDRRVLLELKEDIDSLFGLTFDELCESLKKLDEWEPGLQDMARNQIVTFLCDAISRALNNENFEFAGGELIITGSCGDEDFERSIALASPEDALDAAKVKAALKPIFNNDNDCLESYEVSGEYGLIEKFKDNVGKTVAESRRRHRF